MTEVLDNKVVPALYLLSRIDMDSMNAGKMGAHCGHAASVFAKFYYHTNAKMPKQHKDTPAMNDWHWHKTTQGFGTKMNLAVDELAMRMTVENALKLGFAAEIVHDPEYPLLDGNTLHLIPVDTCAWVFVPDKDDPAAKMLLGNFPLFI